MNSKRLFVLAMLLLFSSSLFAAKKKIYVTFFGNPMFVNIYINGKSEGTLKQAFTRSFTKKVGKKYVITIRSSSPRYSRTQTFVLKQTKDVYFYSPGREPKRSIFVLYKGTYGPVKLYVNGRYKASFKRKVRLHLKSGKTYTFTIRHGKKSASQKVRFSKVGMSVIFKSLNK